MRSQVMGMQRWLVEASHTLGVWGVGFGSLEFSSHMACRSAGLCAEIEATCTRLGKASIKDAGLVESSWDSNLGLSVHFPLSNPFALPQGSHV